MRLFEENLLSLLNAFCGSEVVEGVGLGLREFSVRFGNLTLQSMFKMGFGIGDTFAIWDEVPLDIAVWKILGQKPDCFELKTESTLRLKFTSGDFLDFYTDEGPFEAVLIEAKGNKNSSFLKVY